MSLLVWIVVGAFIFANAFYVAAEFSAVGVRRSRVRRMAEDGNWFAARLLPYVEESAALDHYVGASQIGITLSSLMLGAYGQATIAVALSPLLASWFDLERLTSVSVSAAIVLFALTSLQLVLGELVPKALALQYPTQTALATVLPMLWSLVAFKPFILLLNGAALTILKFFGAEHGHRHLHSPEEIDLMIAESRDGGLLEPAEQQRLRRALHLGLRKARDLMVPLEQLTTLDIQAPWDEVVRVVATSPFSRLPVSSGGAERIVGILRVKDLVDRYVLEGPLPLDRLMRPVAECPADTPADRALGMLRERRMQAAVITDVPGRALGLLTIQDVLGELLGASSTALATREAR